VFPSRGSLCFSLTQKKRALFSFNPYLRKTSPLARVSRSTQYAADPLLLNFESQFLPLLFESRCLFFTFRRALFEGPIFCPSHPGEPHLDGFSVLCHTTSGVKGLNTHPLPCGLYFLRLLAYRAVPNNFPISPPPPNSPFPVKPRLHYPRPRLL